MMSSFWPKGYPQNQRQPQKKTDKDADVDYKVVALDCKDHFLNYTLLS